MTATLIPPLRNPSNGNEERLRRLLGVKLGRPEPVSEEELIAADRAMRDILGAANAATYIDNHRGDFPVTLLPLLQIRASAAQEEGNRLLAEVLRAVVRIVGEPAPIVAALSEAEQPTATSTETADAVPQPTTVEVNALEQKTVTEPASQTIGSTAACAPSEPAPQKEIQPLSVPGAKGKTNRVPRRVVRHAHPIFNSFRPFEGLVPAGFHADYVGAMTRCEFSKTESASKQAVYVTTSSPAVNEEYLEYVNLLQAVANAQGTFTMLDLGAGYGRWLVRAACAVRRGARLPACLVGIESNPERFQEMMTHFVDNGLRSEEHLLIESAVAAAGGALILNAIPDGAPVVSLELLLGGLELVDLAAIHLPSPIEILSGAADALDLQVKRIHISTETREVEASLRHLFQRLGWLCLNDYPCKSKSITPFGQIQFRHGVQSWLNPQLA